MALKIEDNTGQGHGLRITPHNRADVSARSNSRSYYVSRDVGLAFVWVSEFNPASGVHCLYVKNTDSVRDLFIHDLIVGSSQNNVFHIHAVEGNAVGTELTPLNLNRSKSGTEAGATSFGNNEVTGLTSNGTLATLRIAANTCKTISLDDSLILGKGDAITIHCVSSGDIDVNLRGYYETESDD